MEAVMAVLLKMASSILILPSFGLIKPERRSQRSSQGCWMLRRLNVNKTIVANTRGTSCFEAPPPVTAVLYHSTRSKEKKNFFLFLRTLPFIRRRYQLRFMSVGFSVASSGMWHRAQQSVRP
jgi:hypothetical protein